MVFPCGDAWQAALDEAPDSEIRFGRHDVRNHLEHIYAKAGVTNRVSAACSHSARDCPSRKVGAAAS